MAGELKLNNVSVATESGGTVTIAPNNITFAANHAGIKTALNASGSCRAWVNFNGTGTIAARGSGNVSSLTDNGTGDYTITFQTSMPDANYNKSFGGTQKPGVGNNGVVVVYESGAAPTASQLRILCTVGNSSQDFTYVDVAIFR